MCFGSGRSGFLEGHLLTPCFSVEQEFAHGVESPLPTSLPGLVTSLSCSGYGCDGPSQLPVLVFCVTAQGSWALFSIVT